MAGVLQFISITGRYRRLASIATSTLCILCYIPQQEVCVSGIDSESNFLADKILNQGDHNNAEAISRDFDELEEILSLSEDPLAEGLKFLNSLITELNFRYGLSLTVIDACKLVRENLHTLQIPLEAQNAILQTIELLETQENDFGELTEQYSWYWPNEWNWFGLNKKEKKEKQKEFVSQTVNSNPPLIETELPGNCYIGGCELLAGALLCLVPIPGVTWIGGLMVADGTRRVIDGVVQFSDERRADPNYNSPKPPF